MKQINRTLVKLWTDGLSAAQISNRLNLSVPEVYERLALLQAQQRNSERFRVNAFESAVCRACGQDYSKRKHRKTDGLCRTCKEKQKEFVPSSERLERYNLTRAEYDVLFQKQGGACAICKRPEPQLHKALAVDHDHKTGQIRSLLCSKCNMGLGHFQDSPELLQAAIQYLSFHHKDADSLGKTISEVAVTPLSDSVS